MTIEMGNIITIENGVTRMPEWRMAEPVNLRIGNHEHVAIVGRNGAGKSMLVDIIVGKHPLQLCDPIYDFSPSVRPLVSDNVKYITFRDTYGGDNDRTYFLQQRWNQMEIDPNTPVVKDKLEEAFLMAGEDTPQRRQAQRHIYQLFHMEHLLDKQLILLSSGELRKLQLASVLVSCPRILIIDNPYIGLDAGARKVMDDVLSALAADGHIQVILVLNRSKDIPGYITSVMEINDMEAGNKMPHAEFNSKSRASDSFSSINADGHQHHLADSDRDAILELPYSDMEYNAETVADLKSVSIRYGSRTILDHLDWKVRNGEKWALCGENGSGKSTLLSLICADNPQSYACDITLFDRKRGSGESIWDIKRHIGYVSPEMYRSFLRHIPAIQIVANGFFDTAGITRNPGPDQLATAEFWMKIFRIDRLKDRFFTELSSGEQHLCLLARAFVKDPELLILDEPLHCLDERNSILAKDIITAFCQRRNKTLIMVSHYQENFPGIIDRRLTLERKE